MISGRKRRALLLKSGFTHKFSNSYRDSPARGAGLERREGNVAYQSLRAAFGVDVFSRRGAVIAEGGGGRVMEGWVDPGTLA